MLDQHWLILSGINEMADDDLNVAVAAIACVRLKRSAPPPVEQLASRCYAGDIAAGQDALKLDYSYGGADCICTNPPWSRDVLHRLIEHFQNIAPTWLLLDSDWAQTKQAAPFLPSCSDIVASDSCAPRRAQIACTKHW